MKPIYLGLCEESAELAKHYAAAGWRAICIDLLNEPGERDGIEYVRADVRRYLPPREFIGFVAAFTPCTDQAVSGARWFKEKGIHGLAESIAIAEACVRICEWAEAPWMLENPVSTMANYWRKPDYIFQPCEYGDPWLKKTCLWVGGGFKMPPKAPVEPTEGQKIWRMPPSDDRARLRSKTPPRFARAVFEANSNISEVCGSGRTFLMHG